MKYISPLTPRRNTSIRSNTSGASASTFMVSHQSHNSNGRKNKSSDFIRSPGTSPHRRKVKVSVSPRKRNDTENESELRQATVQVCVRLRPILNSDKMLGSSYAETRRSHNRKTVLAINNNKNRRDSSSEAAWIMHSDMCSVSQASSANPDPTRTNTFKFDHAFGPNQTTLDLYKGTVKESIQSFMEGYHTSVFAYGQTATGKTFTMTGSDKSNHENSMGIIQLAIQDCFDYIHNEDERREYLLRVSFMEIYNEVVNDLLTAPEMSSQNNSVPPSAPSIRIFESKKEGVIIRGLKEEIVTSYQDVIGFLNAGEKRRHIGQTSANKESSRSHSVFRLTVESRQRVARKSSNGQLASDVASSGGDSIASSVFAPGPSCGPVRVSTLSLIDLAGSESIKNTGSTGTRKKEGQYINKSLLTLGHVVWKLAELSTKKSEGGSISNNLDTTHIPYRDSKLTRILQPSLSGNAKICLICNISPLSKHLEESHNTLKFANRAKRIKQNATITELVDEKTLLTNYREEIDDLKRQLKDANELKKETSESSSTTSTDENIPVIVEAIHNLERLILTTTTATEKKKRKKRKQQKKIEDAQDSIVDMLGNASVTSGISGDGDEDDDTFLEMLHVKDGVAQEEEDLFDNLSLVSKSLTKASLVSKDDFSLHSKGDTSFGDDTIAEGKKLITELHRIQGLLGSVLVRNKGTPTKDEDGIESADNSVAVTPIKHSSLLTLKDEEVERLRTQLHQQAVATSLRQADSSFLQSQLQEKDVLLKEVSKILESVEQRQLQLEKENLTLKEDWAKSVAALRAKQSECEKTVQLLKGREAEIQQLRKQLER